MAVDRNELDSRARWESRVRVQAAQIEGVLEENGVPASTTEVTSNPAELLFGLRMAMAGSWERLNRQGTAVRRQISNVLGVESIGLAENNGRLELRIVRPGDPAVPLLALLDRAAAKVTLAPATAVLGLDEMGRPVVHPFGRHGSHHLLIGGDQGAGKSTFLRTLAVSLGLMNSQRWLQLAAISPVADGGHDARRSGDSWEMLNVLPHMMADVASRIVDMRELLLFLVGEMEYRRETGFVWPRIVLLIDGAATVLERGGRQLYEPLVRLAEEGGKNGIHLALATSRPDADVLGPHLLTAVQGRYAGRIERPSAWRAVLDRQGAGSPHLLGAGDFLRATSRGTVRFQGAFVDEYDLLYGLSRRRQPLGVLLAGTWSSRLTLGAEEGREEPATRRLSLVDEIPLAV